MQPAFFSCVALRTWPGVLLVTLLRSEITINSGVLNVPERRSHPEPRQTAQWGLTLLAVNQGTIWRWWHAGHSATK
jgi:hypothetical protein